MVAVRINGTESSINGATLPTVSDLVELVKTNIDPEHMITALRLNGRDLEDEDWRSSPTKFSSSVLEVETGTPEQFVTDRFTIAPSVVKSIYMEFRDARKHFQAGEMQEGNQVLAKAVNSLKAFFEWYATLVDIVPEQKRAAYAISTQVEQIGTICKRICQQQLYQSWWALGESIEKDLEPSLDKLEDHFRSIKKRDANLVS